jgi:hypothetical protein
LWDLAVGLVNVTEQEEKVLEAARAYAGALAVMRGKPPFSAWDVAKIVATRNQLLAEAMILSHELTPGPSIPDGAPGPPDLLGLMERFLPRAAHHEYAPD